MKSDLNKNQFVKEFTKHEAIKNNLARIKKKEIPVYGGRPGALPPIEGGLHQVRNGSAPPYHSDDDSYMQAQAHSGGDYHTVVHTGQGAPPNRN